MKKSKDEVFEILRNRKIEDYGFYMGINNQPMFFWVIINTISWSELGNQWLCSNIIDIQPWDENSIRIAIDNVY